MAAMPFHAAAREHQEQAFDVTVTPNATTQSLLQGANQALPAEGFLRNVYLQSDFTGGTGGTLSADGPWNWFQTITLSDVNGAPIYGPIDGYGTFLVNKYGGYMFRGDPAVAPDAVVTTPNFVFALRIPIEVNRQTAFGALANQNAAASYKLTALVNPSTTVWTVAPSPMPTARHRGWIETWTQPLPVDAAGRPQATEPPAHGTTQYWTQQQYTINGGQQIVTLTRVGNLIRSLILVYRNASGVRIALPDPIEIDWDARMLRSESLYYRREQMTQTYGAAAANTVETGVAAYNWDRTIIGHVGGGSTAMYLPTVQSTRLQINANFSTAGTLTVYTNDIAPVEINPNMRYAEGSATGFHPQVGTPIPGAGA